MSDQPDLLDELRAIHKDYSHQGGTREMAAIETAIAEIIYLRSVAGAVSDGPSMADIKARNDRLADSLK